MTHLTGNLLHAMYMRVYLICKDNVHVCGHVYNIPLKYNVITCNYVDSLAFYQVDGATYIYGKLKLTSA